MFSTIGMASRKTGLPAAGKQTGTVSISTSITQSNDTWKGGLRFEWFRDEDGTRVGLNRTRNFNNPPFAGNVYSLSAGVNWTATRNLVIRPELRADWYDGNAARLPYQDGNNSSQFMLGFDAILQF